ncbi:cell cycle checkpoint protein RAD17 isoform X2 [Jatropha curcas]|uniref:cell cycle checkpoint protein RAD17 isoform X2 n=1 Tax=Jatropha curcas TaxID=180498 RepID=UPI0005FB0ED9|nr:cell cycle checkpoint protein RAD17 isoform X2 [Jatropha curcas]
MGKRNAVVVLSSDDEDNETSLHLSRSYSKPKPRALVTRTNPRDLKKPRLSSSQSCLSREASNVNEIRFPCEDFDDLFYGSKVSAGSARSEIKELWIDKYKPRSLEELAVHKKKVEGVKIWFEERLRASKEKIENNVLVITGQAGVGKSTTIHVIASHFGARLCEWSTPTPTIWQEHIHNASADDLPVTNGRVAFERLQNCLLLLVRTTRIPTVILVTDYDKADLADNTSRYMEELQSSLESAGACKVAFNPITNNSIKKALTKICKHEQFNVTAEQIDLIAKASGGDIRNAITSLQLFCVKPNMGLNSSLSNSTPSYSDGKPDDINSLICGFSLLFGRDETLSLFHALGKFLHNKRETEVTMGSEHDAFLLRDKFSRLPLKMDAPEKVLCQAHGQARPIADFLHENVLDFISDEAMDAAKDVASYLSDSDLLISSFRGILARYNEAESVLQSAAASVAVRGVLFGNSHPSPSRWHAIRRPKLWQVEQSLLLNQKETISQRLTVYGGSSFSNMSDVAAEYLPALKSLGDGASGFEAHKVHHKGTWDDSSERMSLDDEEGQISDDEIEDW